MNCWRNFPKLAMLTICAASCLPGAGFSQTSTPQNESQSHARYVVMAPHYNDAPTRDLAATTNTAAAGIPNKLATWAGTIKWLGRTYDFSMVGTDPAEGSATTAVTTYLIPVKIVLATGQTFSPSDPLSDGGTSLNNVLNSPIFVPMKWGFAKTNVGYTQYEDAFQRASFWQDVSTKAKDYHVLLTGPVVLPELVLHVPAADGVYGDYYGDGVNRANVDSNWIDVQLQNYITAHPAITPASFPMFMTYQTYLYQFGNPQLCCVGGYHRSMGSSSSPQTYTHFTYTSGNGVFTPFAADIAAMSHEIGEWIDDPYVDNNSPCTNDSNMEVGDPLENLPAYGTFPVKLNGMIYHPQNLILFDWFTGKYPRTQSVGNQYDLLGKFHFPCSYM